MNNVKNYFKYVMFLIKCNVLCLLISTLPCLGTKQETKILIGIVDEMYNVISGQPKLASSGAFSIFRKFSRDIRCYEEPTDIWKTPHYKEIVANAKNLFKELSEEEQYNLSLRDAKRVTKDYFYQENDNNLKKEMLASWHSFKCTFLELVTKKLRNKGIPLQLPNSDSPADFLQMNAQLDPQQHKKEFMAAMFMPIWVNNIMKNKINVIEKMVKEEKEKEQETEKIIISD